ncbi:MAG: aminomethyl-transferring glycine dehydrogenase [Ignavibacteria bacterium]|nr:aminomethyl-transferring glycine dehydrogenase [Ignavibacteria bacterium]
MGNLQSSYPFVRRHTGIFSPSDLTEMLQAVNAADLDQLISETVPGKIRLPKDLNIPEGISEQEYFTYIRGVAKKNIVAKSYIGMGYYQTLTPAVIQRNILENPGWYTQYTPYQAEISQGRLEALLTFQTMITDLTNMPLANASLLDEATAAAEAMLMAFNQAHTSTKNGNKFFVDNASFPNTIEVLKTRALPFGIELVIDSLQNFKPGTEYFGFFAQTPDDNGELHDYSAIIAEAKSAKVFSIIAADIMSLVLLKSPGSMGADVCVGSTQRFGIPMGFGGPHAAFFAAREEFKRVMPGRIIGASVDSNGKLAYRMALQTREQHIKREKATSNICTAQVLLAIMAGAYAVYHGPEGIESIARDIHYKTQLVKKNLENLGLLPTNKSYFDTLKYQFDSESLQRIKHEAEQKFVNFRYYENNAIGISLGEGCSVADINEIVDIIAKALINPGKFNTEITDSAAIPAELVRTEKYLQSPVFNKYRTETDLMRYLKTLENKDLSLTLSMIPLGSCTMKLNAAVELMPITFPEFTSIHPFAPANQTEGYQEVVRELGNYLNIITGFSGVSFQPNSGAQGEYAGLMVIRHYLHAKGESQRNVCLIPASAHGTNPASAVMAGMKVVVVNCDENGNIDAADLKKKAEEYKDTLAAFMVTYPSTHGVFESSIMELCQAIHDNGGQVYMDGANMNAQVGLTQPKLLGADVCHINLHKTFAIPHGGGGPGMGPICVAEHLVKHLPAHICCVETDGREGTAVSAAPYGSALILMISLGYIKMLGGEGLKESTKYAILNANYLKAKLENTYKVLYTGEQGRAAHEMIFDMREFKKSSGIEVEDIAKRLMDYGFHAPTVSFPVAGTLMVEPTESESKAELDRFIEAMLAIREEIAEIERGTADPKDNVLKNAPHTAETVTSDEWAHAYSRQKAAYPVPYLRNYKFWPAVGRVNNAFGDRNLICTCNDISTYIND